MTTVDTKASRTMNKT